MPVLLPGLWLVSWSVSCPVAVWGDSAGAFEAFTHLTWPTHGWLRQAYAVWRRLAAVAMRKLCVSFHGSLCAIWLCREMAGPCLNSPRCFLLSFFLMNHSTSATHCITFFAGGNALTAFRVRQLLGQVQKIAPGIRAIGARFVHWVSSAHALDADSTSKFRQLLTYGEAFQEESGAGVSIIVTPRMGTVSPWASKATDIARNCGLTEAVSAAPSIFCMVPF